MARKSVNAMADNILPLYMNGLSGRMLRLPPPPRKKGDILVVYGHHTSLERIQGVAEYLNKYSGVTIPDLPGFGGMQSFYKIGEKPDIDTMADYLAAFVKLRYRNRRFSILGLSYGFAVAARMLQKYPEIAKKINILVSWAGFVHKDDFRWKKSTVLFLREGSRFFSMRLPAAFGQHLILRAPLIKATYNLIENRHPKFKESDKSKKKRDERINFEILLWKINDLRTYMRVTVSMFILNLCNTHVDLPVYHVGIEDDHYFDNLLVEQHMRTIFNDFHLIKSKMTAHAPAVIATSDDIAPYVPSKLRQLLNKKV